MPHSTPGRTAESFRAALLVNALIDKARGARGPGAVNVERHAVVGYIHQLETQVAELSAKLDAVDDQAEEIDRLQRKIAGLESEGWAVTRNG